MTANVGHRDGCCVGIDIDDVDGLVDGIRINGGDPEVNLLIDE